MKYIVGVDIGGTAVKIALFDEQGNIYESKEIGTRLENNGEYILDDICNEIEKKIMRNEISSDQLLGVGIGVPGPVIDGRRVLRCVNLGWGEKDVASYIENRLGCQCKIGNDANVAALGESWQGASRNTHSSVMITIGTGIGGGIVLDNKVLTGFSGAAGEIGHMPIHEEVGGRICGCGNVNCLEIFASATGITKSYLSTTNNDVSCKDIFEMARKGEEEAAKAVDEMQKLLGKACAIIGSIINPEVFVIGGGVSKAGNHLIEGIKKYYEQYAFPPIANTEFVLAHLGNNAGVYGAAKLIIE